MRLKPLRGSCSTREAKYAYRKAARKCPQCQAEAIIKGKEEFGGGWVCFKKKGGCGAKFPDDDVAITGQSEGRMPNDDVADQYNTVLKMANKRSLVAAVLNATAASDIFTQDIEDMPQAEKVVNPEPVKPLTATALKRALAEFAEKGIDEQKIRAHIGHDKPWTTQEMNSAWDNLASSI